MTAWKKLAAAAFCLLLLGQGAKAAEQTDYELEVYNENGYATLVGQRDADTQLWCVSYDENDRMLEAVPVNPAEQAEVEVGADAARVKLIPLSDTSTVSGTVAESQLDETSHVANLAMIGQINVEDEERRGFYGIS